MGADIKITALTTCSVGDDGQSVTLCMKDKRGEAVALTLAIHELGMLTMTLPKLMEDALRQRYRDASLRYTHPLAGWAIEQANEPDQIIFTMTTQDGFGVSFSLPRGNAGQLGRALSDAVSRPLLALLN